MAERLADKYEEAKEKQEDIMNRWVHTGLSFTSHHLSLNRVCRHGRTERAGAAALVCYRLGFWNSLCWGSVWFVCNQPCTQKCHLRPAGRGGWSPWDLGSVAKAPGCRCWSRAGNQVSLLRDISCFQGWRKSFGVSTLSFLFCLTLKKIWRRNCRQSMISCSTWAMLSDRWEEEGPGREVTDSSSLSADRWVLPTVWCCTC